MPHLICFRNSFRTRIEPQPLGRRFGLIRQTRKAGVPVSLPIVRSKRPGTVALDTARIYDVAFP